MRAHDAQRRERSTAVMRLMADDVLGMHRPSRPLPMPLPLLQARAPLAPRGGAGPVLALEGQAVGPGLRRAMPRGSTGARCVKCAGEASYFPARGGACRLTSALSDVQSGFSDEGCVDHRKTQDAQSRTPHNQKWRETMPGRREGVFETFFFVLRHVRHQ